MKIVLAALCAALALVAWRLGSLSTTVGSLSAIVARQQVSLADLARQQESRAHEQQQIAKLVEATSNYEDDETREQCAVEADRVFHERGYKHTELPGRVFQDLQSHYNPALKKCFMTIDLLAPGYQSRFLMDAFEQRKYAEYEWGSDGKRAYFEIEPTVCRETLASGQPMVCTSLTEYEEIVSRYME